MTVSKTACLVGSRSWNSHPGPSRGGVETHRATACPGRPAPDFASHTWLAKPSRDILPLTPCRHDIQPTRPVTSKAIFLSRFSNPTGGTLHAAYPVEGPRWEVLGMPDETKVTICPKCGTYAEIILTDTCPRCRVSISKYRAYHQGLSNRAEPPHAGAPRSRKNTSWLDKIKKHLRRIKR